MEWKVGDKFVHVKSEYYPNVYTVVSVAVERDKPVVWAYYPEHDNQKLFTHINEGKIRKATKLEQVLK